MASHQELVIEWTMLDPNYNNWSVEDLQVAAELGRTLLERNEELENDVKSQQAIIDDQAQEIEFLTKQNNAMKEESVTRAKFYEQLESTIFELERTNTQLTRKHESDKKRIQSLCENIDYLERKCEEMSGTLETIRDESKKHYGNPAGKMSRNGYWSSNGSDSSEDDSFLFYKRRSHSLQDLRDYTPSPDEFDSHNSHSPELKASETEFIESLESKIEELISAKKKELDKVHQMEAQMRILIQENANLQEQLNAIQTEKEAEISELRKQLLDTSNYAQQTLSLSSRLSSLSSRLTEDIVERSSGSEGSPVPICSSTFNNGDIANSSNSSGGEDNSRRPSAFQNYPSVNGNSINGTPPTSIVCKRCSAEINLLNLVNSIESENDDAEEMEFSSLEHELARATGRDRLEGYQVAGNKRKVGATLASSPDRSEVWNYWGMRRPSLLDYFLFGGRDEEIGEEACETQVDSCLKIGRVSPLRRREAGGDNNEDDEDPCLLKDRQSEKEGCDANNTTARMTMMNQIPVKKLKLPVKIPYEDEVEEATVGATENFKSDQQSTRWNGLRSDSHDFCDNKILVNNDIIVEGGSDDHESEGGAGVVVGSEDQIDSKSGKSASVKKSSKRKTGVLWWLAWLIVMVLGVFEFIWTLITLMFFVTTAAVLPKSCSSTLLALSTSRFLRPVRVEEEGAEEVAAAGNSTFLPPVSVYLTPASPAVSVAEDAQDDILTVDEDSEEFVGGGSRNGQNAEGGISGEEAGGGTGGIVNNSNVPEYKQILTTMFNLFHNSRRTYPVPVYHLITQARR